MKLQLVYIMFCAANYLSLVKSPFIYDEKFQREHNPLLRKTQEKP